jgi:hypothetical protein
MVEKHCVPVPELKDLLTGSFLKLLILTNFSMNKTSSVDLSQ